MVQEMRYKGREILLNLMVFLNKSINALGFQPGPMKPQFKAHL